MRGSAATAVSVPCNQTAETDFALISTTCVADGARIVTIKRLHEGVIQKIDAGSSSFWKAKNTGEPGGGGLGMMDRQRVKMWLRDVYREIDDVGV